MLKNNVIILCIIVTCAPHVYGVNMVVKPEVIQVAPPQKSQPGIVVVTPTAPAVEASITPTILPVPTPPTPPRPIEKSLTIINNTATSNMPGFAMSIRFETADNPGVIDNIPAGNSKTIQYKPNSLIMYSFENLPSKPITPNMISQDTVTITTPPELMPKAPAAPTAATAALTQISGRTQNSPQTSAVMAAPQLPPSASSQGPPGFKSVRTR